MREEYCGTFGAPAPWVICAVTALLSGICSSARAEVIVALYTGTSRTHSSDLRVKQPASGSDAEFHGVQWEARPFEDSPYYGLRVSYFPARDARLGVNFDFTHYKMFAETGRTVPVRGTWNGAPVDESAPLDTRVQHFEITHGVNFGALDVDYRWVAGRNLSAGSRWQPHVGAGVVAYVPHAEGQINGVSSAGDYQLAAWGYQVFGGTEFRVSRRLGVFAEGKYDQGRLAIDLTPGARAETRVRTLHAIAGVAWHFY